MIKIENFMKVTITTLEGISVRNPNIKQIVYYGHHQHQGICIHGDVDMKMMERSNVKVVT